jgi:exopolysaccharide production protein ExoQ
MKNVLIIALLLLTSGAFISLIVPESFNANTMTAGDENAQLLWGASDLIVIIACIFYSRQLISVASRQPWILAFVGWSTLSLLWSDFPLLTLRRVVGLICTMALGFLLGMRLEMKALLRLVAWALVFTIPLSFIAAIFFPSFGVMHRLDAEGWRGVFNHKNGLGANMGIALIVFTCMFWEYPKNRLKYLLWLLSAVVLLAFSRSMTATIVTAMTLTIGLYRRLRLRPAQKVAIYALALVMGLAATLYLQGRMDSVFALVGRDPSLTGRIPMWQYSADAVSERPLLGAGWDGFWPGKGGDKIRNLVRWEAPHAHNSFLELALNIGVIGLILFLICIFKCFHLAMRYSKDESQPVRLWPLLFYSYSFLYYFTEAPAVDRHTLTFILFCALSVSITEAMRMEAIHDEQHEEYMPMAIASDSTMAQES